MTDNSGPNHRVVADKIGMSVAGVSLIRSGGRNPSMATMEKVEQVFGWPMCDQVAARKRYGAAFNKMLKQWEKENDEQA